MKKLQLVILAALLLSLFQANVLAADRFSPADPGVYTGGGMMPDTGMTAAGTNINTSAPTGPIPLDRLQTVPPMSIPQDLKVMEKEAGKSERRGMLALKVEPGDGLIALSWSIQGLLQKPGDLQPVFTVFYGTEPGRYDKKIEVGGATEHTLRELKNNQVYYIKVQGYTRDGALNLLSKEERAIPLAASEQGSQLEKSFARKVQTMQEKVEADPFRRELKQFGYDFFKNSLATGIPSENFPVGADYVIGPGDAIRIDMWGATNARFDLEVDRNGEITIPRIGALKVWGLTYGQAREAVNRAFSRYYKDYELNVTLGKLRSIQVFVVGAVEVPGTYTISSVGTVINALTLAGGPSKNGSLRSIKIQRVGSKPQEVDLYQMFFSGDRSSDVRLENGDTIFVDVIGPVAAVAGEVRRPAIYELKGTTSLSQLLEMAGGVTPEGDISRIQVERFAENEGRVVQDVDARQNGRELLAKMLMQDRDMVKVFPVFKALRQVVTLQGNVVRPGEYQFRKGMRLADLVTGFEALLPDSWLSSVQVTRLALPDYHREQFSVNLAKALAGDQHENILLQEQDTITVSPRADAEEKHLVAISGVVLNPGSFEYYENMRVRDLVTQAGSLKRNAFMDNAELTRIVVEKGAARSQGFMIDLKKALAGDPEHNLLLQPSDSLIIRAIPDWLEATDRFVTLKGEVVFPGTYSITKGERLSSVIARAGGFTAKAYLRGAKFTRVSVREDQQKRMDEVIARSQQDILRKQGELASLAASKEELEATRASLDGLMKSLEKLKQTRAEGRVVMRLAALEEFRHSSYDIVLRGWDVLDLPQRPDVINVMGQVYSPTTLIHMPGEKLNYYLKKAGGATRDAEMDEMYIIKADGSVESRQQSSAGLRWDQDSRRWTFGGFMSGALDPGDTLVVPQQLERIAWMREIKDITTILSQVAITAGVVIAAGL